VIARLGTSRFWHDGGVGAIAASSDGKLLATAEANRCRCVPIEAAPGVGLRGATGSPLVVLFRLWDARTGKQLAGAFGREGPLQTLAFSPDNRSIAAACFSWLGLYDVSQNGELHLRWYVRALSDGSVSFAADGKSLATYDEFKKALVQLDPQTGKTIRIWKSRERNQPDGNGISEKARIALISSDGRRLAWIMEQRVPAPGFPGAVAVTKTGERVVVFDAANERELYSKRFRRSVQACFSPDNRVLAVTEYGGDSNCVLDAATGKQVCEIRPKQQFLGNDVFLGHQLFSSDGRIFVSMDKRSGEVICSSAKTGKKVATFRVGKLEFPMDAGEGTSSASFSDSSTLWVGQEHRVYRFDIIQGKETTESDGHSRPVTYLSLSDDGRRLFSASHVESILWGVAQRKQIRRFPGDLLCASASLRRAVWQTKSPSDHQGSADATRYELRDLESGMLVKAITTSSGAPLKGAKRFEFSGKTLCCTAGDELWLYDALSGAYLSNAGREAQTVSPDGKLVAACSSTGVITLKALETGQSIRRFKDPLARSKQDRNPSLHRFQFSADSKYLASMPLEEELEALNVPELGPNAIQVWDVAEGREVARIVDERNAKLSSQVHVMDRAPGGQIVGVGVQTQDFRSGAKGFAFSPDHRLLALGLRGQEGVQLWEIASQTEKARFQGQRGAVTCLAFSRDGAILASGAEDGTIWLRALRHRAEGKGPMSRARTDEDLTTCWQTLGERDANKAERAMQVLIDSGGQSIALIRRLCRPVRLPPASKIDTLIRDLDDDQFSVREQATADLGDMGELAWPAIEKAMKGKLAKEARRRLEDVRRAIRPLASSRRDLQYWRAVEVLERIGSSEAQEALRTLASGAAEARVTREAQACLQRMKWPFAGK
jgi:WD40 repeat protein